MRTDRIISPEEVAETIRAYLAGSIDGVEAAWRALKLAGSTDRILAGHQTPLVVEAYWSLRRLAESDSARPGRPDRPDRPGRPDRPDRAEMQYLLDCLEGRRRFRLASANA